MFSGDFLFQKITLGAELAGRLEFLCVVLEVKNHGVVVEVRDIRDLLLAEPLGSFRERLEDAPADFLGTGAATPTGGGGGRRGRPARDIGDLRLISVTFCRASRSCS